MPPVPKAVVWQVNQYLRSDQPCLCTFGNQDAENKTGAVEIRFKPVVRQTADAESESDAARQPKKLSLRTALSSRPSRERLNASDPNSPQLQPRINLLRKAFSRMNSFTNLAAEANSPASGAASVIPTIKRRPPTPEEVEQALSVLTIEKLEMSQLSDQPFDSGGYKEIYALRGNDALVVALPRADGPFAGGREKLDAEVKLIRQLKSLGFPVLKVHGVSRSEINSES